MVFVDRLIQTILCLPYCDHQKSWVVFHNPILHVIVGRIVNSTRTLHNIQMKTTSVSGKKRMVFVRMNLAQDCLKKKLEWSKWSKDMRRRLKSKAVSAVRCHGAFLAFANSPLWWSVVGFPHGHRMAQRRWSQRWDDMVGYINLRLQWGSIGFILSSNYEEITPWCLVSTGGALMGVANSGASRGYFAKGWCLQVL